MTELLPSDTAATTWLCAAGATDCGARKTNEDRFVCDPAVGIFVVADGVGGYAAGEVAAETACALLERRLKWRTGTTAERLREAIAAANNEIYRYSLAAPGRAGMACVLTAVVVEPGRATAGHVGDTRLYRAAAGDLRKVTRDHSIVGVQEDAGVLAEADAMRHPRRNEILRDVGSALHQPDDPGFIDIYTCPFTPGDTLVLCSDGLTDVVPAAVMRQTIEACTGDPEATARALLARAAEAGSPDNVTVIVLHHR